MKYITLNNGVTMPQLGFGVYKIANQDMSTVMKNAFSVGYRSIDTAQYYQNERGLGEAIKDSHLSREELFITTKVWNSHHGYEETLKAFSESLERLQLEYIDMYLIHWPAPNFNKYLDTYRALETLYEQQLVRAIGVCNFDIEHLESLLSHCEIKPAVNQIECHPYFQQQNMKQFCKKEDIFVEAWSPLFRGEEVLNDPIIQALAKKHHKTAAQIILRWHLQEASIVIPKSVTPKRIVENFKLFDFELTDEDMDSIYSLDQNKRRGPIPKEMHLI